MKNAWLKRQRRMLHYCTECGEPAEQTETGKYYALCSKCREKQRTTQKGTLCWRCKNSVPDVYGRRGCNWSRYKLPVEGWTAKETRLRTLPDTYVTSYHVYSCPEFSEG